MSVYARHGLLVRLVYLLIALLWWAGSLAGGLLRGRRRGAVVLCYHGIADGQRRRFARQMALLADRAIDSADVEAAARAGGPRLKVCVTFDDAFANLLRNALPVMQQLEVPATIFAVAGDLGERPCWPMPPGHPEAAERTLAAGQIARARSGLCRFGSHTLTHADLRALTPGAAREQLVRSRERLREILQEPVEDLALPFGSYDDTVLAAARAAGYRRIFTLDPCVRPPEPGLIGRFSMAPDAWACEFRLTCAGGYAWLGPWRRLLRRLRGDRAARPGKEPVLA